MRKEKIYKVTVELEVYGQTSKIEVIDWLEDALHVDGMLLTQISRPVLMKDGESVNEYPGHQER